MEKKNDLSLLFRYRGVLMGFAALWILMFHEWKLLTPSGTYIYEVGRFVKRIGFCGVDIFLMLSGMGMYFSLEKHSLPRFYYNRLKRILFPFWCMAVIVAVVDKWDKIFTLKVMTGIAFYRISIYSFLWFIPAIISFYILVPLYYSFFKRAKNKIIFTVVVLQIWLLVSMLAATVMRQDLYGFTNRIPIFIIGVLFGYLCKEKQIIFSKAVWVLLGSTLVLGLYLAYQTSMKGMPLLVPVSNCCVPNILISVSLPLLLAKGMDLLLKGKLLRGIHHVLYRIVAFFGMMSLEFYCVQEWIGRHILADLVKDYGKGIANLLLLAAVTAAGLVLYFANKLFVKIFDAIDNRFIKSK